MAGAHRLKASERVLEAAAPLIPRSGGLMVALSGGADSAVAAWVALRAAGASQVRAAHVHHGLPASDDLAGAAGEIASMLGLRLVRLDVVVPPGPSLEGRARDVRLPALEAEATPTEVIVTGHHRGDLTETVFVNLLRGAGASGLAGMAGRRGPWIRPLLDVPAGVVRAAASELGLPFLDDPANLDRRHSRNVVRHDVVPWIARQTGAPVESVVARSARLLAEDDSALSDAARQIGLGRSHGAVVVAAAVLATLPGPVASRLARRMLRAAHPPYPGSLADVDAILRVARGAVHRSGLSGGHTVEREGPLVAVFAGEAPVPEAVPLRPGEPAVFGRWALEMRPVGEPPPVRLGRYRVIAVPLGDAVVRGSSPGERIDLGEGSKPVREAMSEAGIPVRLRAAWPVVAAGGKIAWVPGARLADWARFRAQNGGPAVELAAEGTGA